MNPFPIPFPFGHSANGIFGLVSGLWNVLSTIVVGLAVIIGFVAIVAFLILLVRFLVVGTKAAELYLAEHRGEPAAAGPGAAAAAPDAATPAAPEPAPVHAAGGGTTPRKRAPKAPQDGS